ncbi:MAG TPA: hypothetical protein VFD07_03740 [Candidatus Krumholzibacteria bacterium]|nr:hypothetical protein [Candidatus Krumholzibacteria bacterium]
MGHIFLQATARSRAALAACLAVGTLVSSSHPSAAADNVSLFTEWVQDTQSPPGREDFFVDPILFAARGPVYAVLDVGTFARGLEVGGSWRDGRGSSYTTFLRRRQGGAIDDTAFEFGTAQKLRRIVGTLAGRLQWPDHPEENNVLLVPTVGAELYAGSYSFSAFRAILDPRSGAGVAFMLSHRIATRDAFLEGMLVPRTDGALNWSVRGRWRWFHAGYTREDDFDYSAIDRSVWMFGLQMDLDGDELGP